MAQEQLIETEINAEADVAEFQRRLALCESGDSPGIQRAELIKDFIAKIKKEYNQKQKLAVLHIKEIKSDIIQLCIPQTAEDKALFLAAMQHESNIQQFNAEYLLSLFLSVTEEKDVWNLDVDSDRQLWLKLKDAIESQLHKYGQKQCRRFHHAYGDREPEAPIETSPFAILDTVTDKKTRITWADFKNSPAAGVFYIQATHIVIKTFGFRYYVIDCNKPPIGKGGFAEVRMAHAYNPTMQTLRERVVVKVFERNRLSRFGKLQLQNTDSEILQEARFLKKSFPCTEMPVNDDTLAYLVTEYVPGINLGNSALPMLDIHSSVSTLPFYQRVKLLYYLMLDLNSLHHNRLSGDALIHGDLKLENIRVLIENGEVKGAWFVDFGLSGAIEDDSKYLVPHTGGTPLYMSPELFRGEAGLKSDIRSFVPIILSVLGIKEPFEKTINRYFAEFDVVKLNTLTDIPDAETLTSVMAGFFNKMGMWDYANRSDGDKGLRFFNALNNYCVADKAKDMSDEEKAFRKAQFLVTMQLLGDPDQLLGNDVPLPSELESQCDLFMYISKDTQSYNRNKEKWHALATSISKNINTFSEHDTLIFLKKLLERDPSLEDTAIRTLTPQKKREVFLVKFLTASKNYEGNEKAWLHLANRIVPKITEYTAEQQLTIFREFCHQRNRKNGALSKFVANTLLDKLKKEEKLPKMNMSADRLAYFIFLSKKNNYKANELLWQTTAEGISGNLNDYSIKQKLAFLRMLNKHDSKAIADIKRTVTASLTADLDKVSVVDKKDKTIKKLTYAVSGSFTFFNALRAKHVLKAATKSEKDKQIVDAVNRVAVAARAA